jgi:hypothetical protein
MEKYFISVFKVEEYMYQENSTQQAEGLSPAICLAYSSTLKMEATCLPETSVDYHRTRRRPQDRTLHTDRCGSLKSRECNTYSLQNNNKQLFFKLDLLLN